MATILHRDGRYRITVSSGYVDGKQVRRVTTWTPDPGMTKRQIDAALAREVIRFEDQIKAGQGLVDPRIRFKDFSKRYISEYGKTYLKPTTVANYERDLVRINQAIGHIRLNELRPGHITSFYANLQEDGINQRTSGKLDPVSIASIHRTLSAVLGKAVKWGYIPDNPAKRAERPKAPQKEAAFLDEEDAHRLLRLLQREDIRWRTMITFDLLSGLRRAELLGLRWQDVDMDNQTITVRQTSNYVPGQGIYISKPKTAKSSRPLKLSSSAIILLLEYQRWQDDYKAKLGDAWLDQDGRVFTRDNGLPLFPTSITQWFHKFLVRNGFPSGVSVHSLRHTYASLMIAEGTPIIVVSRRLGHSKASTTADIYAHVIASAEARAIEATDRFADDISQNEAAAL